MVARKASSKAGSPSSLNNDRGRTASPSGIEVTGDGRLATSPPPADTGKPTDGGAGPPSSLKTGKAQPLAGDGTATAQKADRGQRYSVQVHTDEHGLQVIEVTAKTGDEAAQKALEQHKYVGTSVRGVTPASDPDPNSLGGEREASNMIRNATNRDVVHPLGTEANAKASENLGKGDIKELGE